MKSSRIYDISWFGVFFYSLGTKNLLLDRVVDKITTEGKSKRKCLLEVSCFLANEHWYLIKLPYDRWIDYEGLSIFLAIEIWRKAIISTCSKSDKAGFLINPLDPLILEWIHKGECNWVLYRFFVICVSKTSDFLMFD